MTGRIRVVALGRQGAGDDGVGAEVLLELQRLGTSGVDLFDLVDAAHLVDILLDGNRVVLVDAVIGSPPGQLVEPTPDQLVDSQHSIAIHGFGAATAVALARALSDTAIDLRIVGITITPSIHRFVGLSGQVAAAVPAATRRVLAVIDEIRRPGVACAHRARP